MDAHKAAMVDAETAVIGIDHAEVGHYLTQRWSLPEVLQEAVGFHHAPRGATQHAQLAALIGYADHVVRVLKLGNGGGEAPVLDHEFHVVLPLPEGSLDAMCEELEESLSEQVNALVAL